jgi:hypothetical protein
VSQFDQYTKAFEVGIICSGQGGAAPSFVTRLGVEPDVIRDGPGAYRFVLSRPIADSAALISTNVFGGSGIFITADIKDAGTTLAVTTERLTITDDVPSLDLIDDVDFSVQVERIISG